MTTRELEEIDLTPSEPTEAERAGQSNANRRRWLALIQQVRDGNVPAYLSTAERITVALGADRYDLLPIGWRDPLAGYMIRLDDDQRHAVRVARGWEA